MYMFVCGDLVEKWRREEGAKRWAGCIHTKKDDRDKGRKQAKVDENGSC